VIPTEGALTGLTVVDFSNFLPGPYATMILGDHGADVIKVERPGAGDPGRYSEPTVDGVATRHRVVNRNKRSVVLDLRDDAGIATARRLIDGADILVEGFRPGSMTRLGLGYEQVRDSNPGLIYCSIGGFATSSAEAEVPAHDLNFMGLAGLLAPDPSTGVVSIPPTQYADIAGGSFRAVIGILLALHERARSGLGQQVEASLMGGALALQMESVACRAAGVEFVAGSTRLTGKFPCYRVYPTSDGRHLAVGATESAFWTNLCEVIDRPDLVSHQYASGDAARWAITELEAVFATHTLADWVQRLEGRQTCCTPVRSAHEALDELCASQGSPDGLASAPDADLFRMLGSPVQLGRSEARFTRPAPALGEHTREVLDDLQLK
jgi:crotonobetainyl-CoA:carnitine CoA-transferase CaiB-like acyl-CoA transferase